MVPTGARRYMPNEYFHSGQVSEKTDAYSFGMVLMELITGKSSRAVAVMVTTDDAWIRVRVCVLLRCVTCVQCVVWVSGCLRVWVRLPHACLQDLPAHADERAGKWPRKMLNDGMAPITQKLLEYRVQDRGTIAELLPKLEALARAHH